jgi:hypothetical protein
VIQQLWVDFPFLKRTVTGAERDLRPYERPATTTTALRAIETTPSTRITVRKYLLDGRLVIERDGVRYNAMGRKM